MLLLHLQVTPATRSFGINRENVTVSINTPTLIIGENTTFTGKVNGVDNDNLVFTVNGVEGATVNVAAGTYTVVATFNGNDTHNSGSATATFEVNKTYTAVTIDDVVLTIGESVIFTGKVNGVAYSGLTFSINGVPGATISSVSSGTYSVTATFTENATHYGNSTTRVFSADKTSAVIESVGAEPVYDGTESVIKVTMNNVESGFVLISVDGGNNISTAINNYTGNCSVSLGVGMHNVTVYYIGDSEYTEAAPKQSIIVVNDKEATLITIDPVDLVVGENATITAKLNGLDNDNLVYEINGVVTDTINPVEAIPYTVTVSFPGNSTHKATNITQTYSADKVATSISVNAIETVTIGYSTTVTVNPSVNTGNAIIYINGTGYYIDLSKTNNLTVTLPNVGNYTVNATYQANGKYLESHSSNVIAEVIDKETPTITIDANKTGEVHVSVSGNSSGNVTLYVNGENEGTKTLVNGAADYTVEFGEGPQSVSATYSGDGKHYNSNSTVVIEGYDSTTYINGSDITMYYGGGNSYTIRLYDSRGSIAGKPVQFVLNNQIYNRTTNANGEASISLNLPLGTYVVSVSFTHDEEYPSASRTNTIKVLSALSAVDLTRGYNSPYDFQATFLSSTGDKLANSNVHFKADGKTYTVKTDSNGVGKLTAKLKVGTHSVVVISPYGEQITKKSVIVKRIVNNKNLVMYYDDGSSFKVRVYGDNGKIAGAGEIVTFVVHGVTYKVKTNAKGIATLNINLAHRTYTIKTSYKGESVVNKIAVKNIIKAKKTTIVKKTTKALKIKITLKGKKVYKYKKLTIKFRGKNYAIKTNAKGVAYFKLSAKQVSNLKKGTTSFNIKYKLDAVKRYIKVQ